MKVTKLNRFDDIEHYPIKTYNRAAVAYNLLEDFGLPTFEAYVMQFNDADRKAIGIMIEYVKYLGQKAVVSLITKDMDFSDEDYVEDENNLPETVQVRDTFYNLKLHEPEGNRYIAGS